MQIMIKSQKFCGRNFSSDELLMIQEVVSTCDGVSRTELAHTVCELLEWKRPSGGLKSAECKDLLKLLENKGIIKLPRKRHTRVCSPQTFKEKGADSTPHSKLSGSVDAFLPLDIQRVQSRDQRDLFRNLLSRYHYLGYAMPFGGAAPIFDSCDAAQARSGGLHTIFQPCLADESKGSMDWLE